ncbi:hypothetical protein M3223_08445 [Paenibacillus pasadenensis]|uniref:YphA family membrane protein n=1 Tax=Paenibacillus pasadenensis TaxID=217090 RepID=UPI00203ABADD|nr:hypothetical protein [Paenibacillus pasadenensis]MCM3747383.1 hypothetical protein [Paenibacillus pasadenensis]
MTTIEDGFLAAEAAVILIIMLWSGWNQEAAGGLKTASAVAAMALLLLCGAFRIDGERLVWNVAAIALMFIAAWVWRNRIPRGDKMYLIGCALLLGFVQIWLNSLFQGSPQLIISRPGWDTAVISGSLAALLTLRAPAQFFILSAATLFASIYPIWEASAALPIVIGEAAWWDKFALSAVCCRLSTVALQAMMFFIGKVAIGRRSRPEREG